MQCVSACLRVRNTEESDPTKSITRKVFIMTMYSIEVHLNPCINKCPLVPCLQSRPHRGGLNEMSASSSMSSSLSESSETSDSSSAREDGEEQDDDEERVGCGSELRGSASEQLLSECSLSSSRLGP